MRWLLGKITDLTEDDYQQIYRTLSPSRKERVDRLKKQDDRRRSLMAAHLLTQLLKEVGEDGAVLESDQNGRPFLRGSDQFVSISHSHEAVVCAISDTPIGIDIEKMKPVRPSLIAFVCTEREREFVLSDAKTDTGKGTAEDGVSQKFYAVWTAKEAYFKKIGTGITNLRSVDTLSLEKQVYVTDGFFVTIV